MVGMVGMVGMFTTPAKSDLAPFDSLPIGPLR
jgi:hypothetical protein